MIRTAVLALAILAPAASAVAQTGPRASDVESPESIVLEHPRERRHNP